MHSDYLLVLIKGFLRESLVSKRVDDDADDRRKEHQVVVFMSGPSVYEVRSNGDQEVPPFRPAIQDNRETPLGSPLIPPQRAGFPRHSPQVATILY